MLPPRPGGGHTNLTRHIFTVKPGSTTQIQHANPGKKDKTSGPSRCRTRSLAETAFWVLRDHGAGCGEPRVPWLGGLGYRP